MAKHSTLQSRQKLKTDFMRHMSVALTPKDQMLYDLSLQLISKRYDEQRRRLVACGWGQKQPDPYWCFQLNASRARECSICAEGGVLMKAQDNDDEIEVIVTVHGPDKRKDKPYVVPPCAMCVTRLQRFAPNAWVILEFESKLVKLPQDGLMSFPYPID